MRNQRNGNTIRVRDALIEEVLQNRNTGVITISYGEIGQFNMIHTKIVKLLVDQNTVIQNQFGQKMFLKNLEKGMTINAEFSNLMTASMPPQARAIKIIVLNENNYLNIKRDKIIMVDVENNFFVTGRENNRSSQIHFNVSPFTIILDRRGNRICLCDLKVGHMVKVKYAKFMTFSIPPQTAAYQVQLL